MLRKIKDPKPETPIHNYLCPTDKLFCRSHTWQNHLRRRDFTTSL